MRIGQLARRLGLTTTDLITFLSSQNLDAEANANSRLTDGQTQAIVLHFAPARLDEILASPVAEVEPTIEAPPPTPVPEPVVEQIDTVDVPTEQEPVSTQLEEPKPEEVEVIRVSKVELQGLKVLGKIDLPESKKKLEPTGEETTAEQRTSNYERSRESRRRESRPWKNPLEAQRRREAEEAERKKQEEIERQKEQRANHYYKKVKSVPTKSVRRVEEPLVVEDLTTKEPPKTVLGKVWRWLTS